MTTIPVQAQMSTEQLLSALEEVPPQEFSALVDRRRPPRGEARAAS
jgi:hypothetical protein